MARSFASGTPDWLEEGAVPVSAAPLTIAGWMKPDDVDSLYALACITDTAADADFFAILAYGTVGGDPVRAFAKSTAFAATTTGYTPNNWHHMCGVFTSSTSRSVFLDGGGKGTDATDSTPAGLDATALGALRRFSSLGYLSGGLADIGIWNVALSDAEVAVLAMGYACPFVRPENLVRYWSLLRNADRDIVGGTRLTANGSPGMIMHPNLTYPSERKRIFAVPAAGPPGLAGSVVGGGMSLIIGG